VSAPDGNRIGQRLFIETAGLIPGVRGIVREKGLPPAQVDQVAKSIIEGL
jgi:hypothetical protein